MSLLYSTDGNDEHYTPAYAVEPILKYIPKGTTVWCPFDTEESEFVKLISELPEVKVVYGHISTGQDFFEYEPDHWDMIVSNPPFKNKRTFFERALALGKPFALIMTNTWLNDAAPKQLFADRDLQLLMFSQRIRFTNPYGVANDKITFSSSYYCYNFLPKQIIMEELRRTK